MKTGTSVIFDPEEALAIVDGDRNLFSELVALFRQNYPSELSSIRDAIRLQDWATLETASHQLKGSLSAVAAGDAQESARRLETIGREADHAGAGEVFARMEQQVQALTLR